MSNSNRHDETLDVGASRIDASASVDRIVQDRLIDCPFRH